MLPCGQFMGKLVYGGNVSLNAHDSTHKGGGGSKI